MSFEGVFIRHVFQPCEYETEYEKLFYIIM